MTKSLTQPQRGDEVILQRTGRDAVTVQRQENHAVGQIQSRPVDVYRNRLVIEKREFFEERAEAARIVRDDTIKPREAVREHPELAGTYLSLRAAELAARGLRDSEDQRRFVAQVRRALADDIKRGEPLQPVRLRERSIPGSVRRAREVDRDRCKGRPANWRHFDPLLPVGTVRFAASETLLLAIIGRSRCQSRSVRWLPVTVNSEESLTFWFAARPTCAPGRGARSAGCPEN